jgi:hypothetical protein
VAFVHFPLRIFTKNLQGWSDGGEAHRARERAAGHEKRLGAVADSKAIVSS